MAAGRRSSAARSAPKRINVALQGGGAHGAFSWGALLRLLEDERIEIAGITGTSAGALNGAAVKSGLCDGGRDKAIENLNWLWREVGAIDDARFPRWFMPFGLAGISKAMELSPAFQIGDAVSRAVSPYAQGPFYQNPLKRIVQKLDFESICAHEGPAFFVNATRVRDGRARVFKTEEICPEVIMASACLPTLFQAVELFDRKTGRTEAFWDGGYTGNPALFPLFPGDLPEDIVIININPLERDEVPVQPQQIQNRLNEISFNASLMKELRAINFVQRLLKDGTLKPGRMSQVLIHMISDDTLMTQLSVATKLVANPIVLGELRAAGHAAADRFLNAHFNDLNERPSVDLEAMF